MFFIISNNTGNPNNLIKKVVVVGNAKFPVIAHWEKKSNKSEVTRGLYSFKKKEIGGTFEAGVGIRLGDKREYRYFDFEIVENVDKAIELIENMDVKRKKIATIIAKKGEGCEKMLYGKVTSRYHYTPYGWVVLFDAEAEKEEGIKVKIERRDIEEFAGMFFSEKMLYSNMDYEDINVTLKDEMERYEKESRRRLIKGNKSSTKVGGN